VRQPDVVVVGGVSVDTAMAVPRLPAPGRTATAVASRRACGGKARNQAVAAARAGAGVAIVARVGDDDAADVVLDDLAAADVDVVHVRRTTGVHTGTYVSLTDDAGTAIAAWQPGANRALGADDVRAAGHLIAAAAYVVCQLEVPDDAVAAAMRAAAGRVVLDVGPSPARAHDLLDRAWLVHANADEAAALTGVDVTDQASARRAAEVLLGRGPSWASVSAGGAGDLLASADATWWVPTPDLRVVDTVGAGDALLGSLVGRLAGGAAPPEALAAGADAASAVVQRLGPG
jgi:ribokinase